MSRKLCLVSIEVGNLLVTQLAHELKNFNLYMSFANYFGVEGISDLEYYYDATEDTAALSLCRAALASAKE